jgi:hypothetical protein
LLLVLASTVTLGCGTQDHIFIVPILWTPQTWRARSSYILQVAQIYPRALGWVRKLKLKLIYDRQSVGQSVLVSGTHLGPATNFFFLLEIFFRHLRVCYFVAPSLTKGRVCNLLYNCFWALPEHLLLGRSPAELTAIFYCLI